MGIPKSPMALQIFRVMLAGSFLMRCFGLPYLPQWRFLPGEHKLLNCSIVACD